MTSDGLPGYLLESTLGAGTTGTVHLARRADWLGRVVAVKRVPHTGGTTARALRREAEVLAGLDHPHIVRILDVVPDGDGVAIAMQYAPGGSLADLLARRGRLAPGEVVAVAAPLADALASAHRQGVLHCDVKPANVLFTSDGEPLLSDFGLARRIADLGPVPAGAAGTAEYLDPAVADGGSPDERSDVYGLGIVCYEALAGHPPFAGPTPEAVVASATAGDPVALALSAPGAPSALAHAVERAIARHPGGRWPDASAFAIALRAAIAPVPVRLDQPASLPPPAVGPALPPGYWSMHPAAAALRNGEAAVPVAGPAPAPAIVRRPDVGGPTPTRPTRLFGPRPPRPASPPAAGRRRRHPVRRLATVGVTAVLGIVAVALATALFPGGQRPATARPDQLPVPSTSRCPPAPGPLRADVDGDGCPSSVTWKDNVATVEGRRYQVGRPGDLLLLGDWNCDRIDTPALYRPTTGEVFRFDAWAGAGTHLEAVPTDRLTAGAAPNVVTGTAGCDDIAIR